MEIQSIKNRFGIIGNSPALNYALQVAVQVAAAGERPAGAFHGVVRLGPGGREVLILERAERDLRAPRRRDHALIPA